MDADAIAPDDQREHGRTGAQIWFLRDVDARGGVYHSTIGIPRNGRIAGIEAPSLLSSGTLRVDFRF